MEVAQALQAVQARASRRRRGWPLFVIALPAAVAVWSGWVGLGGLCGFGLIRPLPGIADSVVINTAITLPVGVEAYGAYALGIWADAATPERVRKFAFRSALGSLLLGLLGQVAFHLLSAAGYARAPWPVVVFVSCIPVAALGFGMGLHQLLIHTVADEAAGWPQDRPDPEPVPALDMDEVRREITETVAERLALESADPAAARHIEASLAVLRGEQPAPVAAAAAPVIPELPSRTAVLDELARTITRPIPEPAPGPEPVPAPAPKAAAPKPAAPKPEPKPAAKGSRAATERRDTDPPLAVIRAAKSAEQLAADTGISRWRAQQLLRPGSYAMKLRDVNGTRTEQAG